MNAKVDKFLDACARDPWFAAHPEALKTIQGELTRIDEKSPDDAAVQTDWDSVSEIVSRKDSLVDRCIALAKFFKTEKSGR